MNIVFLDADTLGKKDLGIFEQFGNFTFYPFTQKEEINERIKEAEIVITNKVCFGKEEFQSNPKLKLLLIAATGYNNVNLEEAHKHGVKVANVKGYSTESVAQLTLSYILALSSSLLFYDKDVKDGMWTNSPIFTMLHHPFRNLAGKKLGIIGYGTIAKKVEKLAKAFDMEILISKSLYSNREQEGRLPFEEVVEQSDFITLHCPLSKETEGLFGEKEFDMMKESAYIINTSRGPVVDEEALYDALKNKKIAGGAIDVMKSEPPREGSKLFELNNIIITPHIAWASDESIDLLIEGLIANIKAYLDNSLVSL